MALYYPQVFDVKNTQDAKAIILTDEGRGGTTDARWAQETPYVLELITASLAPTPETLVLDYGCGIGRLAKALIQHTNCQVIGVDISRSMRELSVDYVASDRFLAVSPEGWDLLVRSGLRVQAAISVWVLQHCFAVADDVDRIRRGLAAQGRAFVLNMPKRAVPALLDGVPTERQFTWADDGADVAGLLRSRFVVSGEGVPDTARAPHMADAGAFWMTLRQHGP